MRHNLSGNSLVIDNMHKYSAWVQCSHFYCSKVKEYFLNSYQLYHLLFSAIQGNVASEMFDDVCVCDYNYYYGILLDDSYFYKTPDRLRLPLIFYFAHTASVYINKLVLAGLLQVSSQPLLRLANKYSNKAENTMTV